MDASSDLPGWWMLVLLGLLLIPGLIRNHRQTGGADAGRSPRDIRRRRLAMLLPVVMAIIAYGVIRLAAVLGHPDGWWAPMLALILVGGLIEERFRPGETKAEKRARNVSRLRLLAVFALFAGSLFLIWRLMR